MNDFNTDDVDRVHDSVYHDIYDDNDDHDVHDDDWTRYYREKEEPTRDMKR